MPPKACVIGWPVSHSRSPLIHSYWLRENGLAGHYEIAAVEPSQFAGFVSAMRDHGFVGGNVTIPHKEAAASLCDERSATAEQLGSVNTLWWEDGRLHGDSTDGVGFTAALDDEVPGWGDRRGRAVVVGAGGAARAVVHALHGRGWDDIVVANRTPARAEQLASTVAGRGVALDAVDALMSSTDLLVNTTAAGMIGAGPLPLDISRLPDHAVVDDIVYVPEQTPLLAAARARGLRNVGGLGMLLHQAAPGFARWFGVKPVVTSALRHLVAIDVASAT